MESTKLKLIGKGMFSKVYRVSEKEVIIKSFCPAKECMALFFDKSKYFPPIERIDYQEYKMPYYDKVSSLKTTLKPKQYQLYLELRKLSIPYTTNRYNKLNEWENQFKTIKDKILRNNLLMAVGELSNYGQDISFEISPRNVAVKNGNLILLDCFYSSDLVNKIRTK